MDNSVLVSVIVITYNSEKYVIETLESVKNQYYENIELIVTDDSSTDNTLAIVKQWINKNKNNFSNYRIVESEINTGITPNCNRGLRVATGTYVKLIAGDDILLENCISDLVNYVIEKDILITYAKVSPFTDAGEKIFEKKLLAAEKVAYEFFELDAEQQYRKLLKCFCISTIGLFFNRKFVINLGAFDEKYKMMEDYPLAIKVSEMGYRLNMLDKYVAKYRVRPMEMRKTMFSTKRKNIHSENLRDFQANELLPRMKKKKMYLSMYDLKINMFADKIDSLNEGIIFSIFSRVVRYLSLETLFYKMKLFRKKHSK